MQNKYLFWIYGIIISIGIIINISYRSLASFRYSQLFWYNFGNDLTYLGLVFGVINYYLNNQLNIKEANKNGIRESR